jgi:hypothetical protein
MNTLRKPILLFIPLLVLFVLYPIHSTYAQQETVTPTATYDPLDEPLLPQNPTEYELGRNLYWHWCMTCHGDRGQGLTDEFRGIWEPEHQNCWGRGCHAGRPGDTGFPIPTVVPALVEETHLSKFISVQNLSDYLKATHPPQSPGILKDEEYHAIAVFVFAMNERPLIFIPATDTPTPTLPSTQTLASVPGDKGTSSPIYAILFFIVVIVVVSILAGKNSTDTS